jgi:hypothetical protein
VYNAQKFRTIKFPFCPTAPQLWRYEYDVASCTGVASLCWTWRQSKDSIYWDFHVNLSLNNLCLLKEEKTPVAMSTNSFPETVNFLGVWAVVSDIYTIVLQDESIVTYTVLTSFECSMGWGVMCSLCDAYFFVFNMAAILDMGRPYTLLEIKVFEKTLRKHWKVFPENLYGFFTLCEKPLWDF